MNQITLIRPTRVLEPRPKQYTSEDVRAMRAAGVFGDRRVELIGGGIFEMPDEGVLHQGLRERIQNWLVMECGLRERGRWFVGANEPTRLARADEPEPDIYIRPAAMALLRFDCSACPLLLEIASTSHAHDFGTKVPLYARYAATEFWIIDAVRKQTVVHRGPDPEGGWAAVLRFPADQSVSPLAFPDLQFRLAEHLSDEDENA